MLYSTALLILADGSVFKGYSIGAPGIGVGELVFNTAMTGYQEMLTDPSYAGQILTLTTAHVGNVGCNHEDNESDQSWVSGLVVREAMTQPSNYRAEQSLPYWLKAQGIVAIAGIDTRALTHRLRDHGVVLACVTTNPEGLEEAKAALATAQDLNGLDLAKTVSRKSKELWSGQDHSWFSSPKSTPYHVVVYDFGVKASILQYLSRLGCRLTLVPAETSAAEVMALKPNGIVLSNGPGDPTACDYAIQATQFFLKKSIPLFGICLGFQILALALGAKTYKMTYGHHGANHPVIDLIDRRQVYITSQNHGFAVDEATLPVNVQITHRSLFDSSLQGIKHLEKPVFGFQGHPESSPGPHDLLELFSVFIESMQVKKIKGKHG